LGKRPVDEVAEEFGVFWISKVRQFLWRFSVVEGFGNYRRCGAKIEDLQ
jgi:hypothetical protein